MTGDRTILRTTLSTALQFVAATVLVGCAPSGKRAQTPADPREGLDRAIVARMGEHPLEAFGLYAARLARAGANTSAWSWSDPPGTPGFDVGLREDLYKLRTLVREGSVGSQAARAICESQVLLATGILAGGPPSSMEWDGAFQTLLFASNMATQVAPNAQGEPKRDALTAERDRLLKTMGSRLLEPNRKHGELAGSVRDLWTVNYRLYLDACRPFARP